MKIRIKQGDAYLLPVGVAMNGKAPAPEDLEKVEFTLGGLRWLYPDDTAYDTEHGAFLLPLGQEDTLSLPAGSAVGLDVRVRFVGGAVLGARKIALVEVLDALSTEVI